MLRPMPKTEKLPHALYTAAQVRELDRIAIEEFEIPGDLLMERAGAAAYRQIRQRWPQARDITVVVGTGNNGGDGFVVARLGQQAGLKVRVLQLGDVNKISGSARLHLERFRQAGGEIEEFHELPLKTDLIVDGIFGTGLERDVSGYWADAVQLINRHRAPVLALDIPSGLHADHGQVLGDAVMADVTVTFIGLKRGQFTGEGPACCGELLFDALEVPARIYGRQLHGARRLDWQSRVGQIGRRSRTAHKGHFGHVLVIGGDHGFGGAARLAAEAAARVGAGLVSVATRTEHVAPILSARPELMAHGVDSAEQLEPLLRKASVIAIGPGLGQGDWGRALWHKVRETARPLVVDADALNLLAEDPMRRDDWVLTPHPGEAARLLGVCAVDARDDRFGTLDALVKRFGGKMVLKGAGTLTHVTTNKPPGVCSDGNPGMASGGMGDVLTGIIAGLLAQGWHLDDAVEHGVCLHAAAADRAAKDGERGLLASDLFAHLRPLLNAQ